MGGWVGATHAPVVMAQTGLSVGRRSSNSSAAHATACASTGGRRWRSRSRSRRRDTCRSCQQLLHVCPPPPGPYWSLLWCLTSFSLLSQSSSVAHTPLKCSRLHQHQRQQQQPTGRSGWGAPSIKDHRARQNESEGYSPDDRSLAARARWALNPLAPGECGQLVQLT